MVKFMKAPFSQSRKIPSITRWVSVMASLHLGWVFSQHHWRWAEQTGVWLVEELGVWDELRNQLDRYYTIEHVNMLI